MAALAAVIPNSGALAFFNTPLNDPIGVLVADKITTCEMDCEVADDVEEDMTVAVWANLRTAVETKAAGM